MKAHSVGYYAILQRKRTPPKLPVRCVLFAVLLCTAIFWVTVSFPTFIDRSINTFAAYREGTAMQQLLEHNRELILQKRVTLRLSRAYVPVHIFRNGDFAGSGVLVDEERGMSRILTMAHLFPRKASAARYHYESLLDGTRHPIATASYMTLEKDSLPTNDPLCDLASCVPGPARKIAGFSNLLPNEVVDDRSGGTGTFTYVPLDTPVILQSLVSAEEVTCRFVTASRYSPSVFFLLPVAALNGESGSGWVDKEGNLYLAGARFDVGEDSRAELGLRPGLSNLTAVTRITVPKMRRALAPAAVSE